MSNLFRDEPCCTCNVISNAVCNRIGLHYSENMLLARSDTKFQRKSLSPGERPRAPESKKMKKEESDGEKSDQDLVC